MYPSTHVFNNFVREVKKKKKTSMNVNENWIAEYSNYGGGRMVPNNFGGQANFSVPPPSFGGNQQFKNDNQGNWQNPSAGEFFFYCLTKEKH